MIKRIVTTESGSTYFFQGTYGARMGGGRQIEGSYLGDFEVGTPMRLWGEEVKPGRYRKSDTTPIVDVEVIK